MKSTSFDWLKKKDLESKISKNLNNSIQTFIENLFILSFCNLRKAMSLCVLFMIFGCNEI